MDEATAPVEITLLVETEDRGPITDCVELNETDSEDDKFSRDIIEEAALDCVIEFSTNEDPVV